MNEHQIPILIEKVCLSAVKAWLLNTDRKLNPDGQHRGHKKMYKLNALEHQVRNWKGKLYPIQKRFSSFSCQNIMNHFSDG